MPDINDVLNAILSLREHTDGGLASLRTDLAGLGTDLAGLGTDLAGLGTGLAGLREYTEKGFSALRAEVEGARVQTSTLIERVQTQLDAVRQEMQVGIGLTGSEHDRLRRLGDDQGLLLDLLVRIEQQIQGLNSRVAALETRG